MGALYNLSKKRKCVRGVAPHSVVEDTHRDCNATLDHLQRIDRKGRECM